MKYLFDDQGIHYLIEDDEANRIADLQAERALSQDDDDLEIDQLYDVSCSLPDLRYVMALALGAVMVFAVLGVWLVNRLRPW